VDHTLLVDYAEYADRVIYYGEAGEVMPAGSMHGLMVASVAAGGTTGVAPEAYLYFAGVSGFATKEDGTCEEVLTDLAQALEGLPAWDDSLPQHHRIRVVSISNDIQPRYDGYEETMDALKRAEERRILVVTLSREHGGDIAIMGLERQPLADPDQPSSYEPPRHPIDGFFPGAEDWYAAKARTLFAPISSRTHASPTGKREYAFGRHGGLSQTVPYIAGVYALACQVEPEIAPDEFWRLVMETGHDITVEREDLNKPVCKVINPMGLIEVLQGS